MLKLTCFIIQLFLILPLFSQSNSTNEIDSILDESFQKFAELQFVESSNLADHALELSNLKNYSKGKVTSSLYVAKVLIEIGLNMEAIKYIQRIYEEPFFKENVLFQVESHRLKGKIYGSQQLYSLAREEFQKQLFLSERISDPKKKELSKLWAYQNIEHLYFLQGLNDSIEVYQNLQEKQLNNFEEHEVFYNISSLYASKARLYLSVNKFDSASLLLQKSIDLLNNYNFPYKYYSLQIFGDMEAAKGNIDKAISYYNQALENSVSLNVSATSRDLHLRLAEYMFERDTLIDRAVEHGREYAILNDSLENHNRKVVDAVFENIIKDNMGASTKKSKLFRFLVIGIIFISITIGALLIVRNLKGKKDLSKKNQQIIAATAKIRSLEEGLEDNIFNEIVELARSNSPEFLPLFGKAYPKFIESIKHLDPTIRSSELYFCALAYLNFSTKDIANFTFVTPRAVQIRKNRLRKKYNILSEIDFNEWFRDLENMSIPVDDEIIL